LWFALSFSCGSFVLGPHRPSLSTDVRFSCATVSHLNFVFPGAGSQLLFCSLSAAVSKIFHLSRRSALDLGAALASSLPPARQICAKTGLLTARRLFGLSNRRPV
jgi:hypothetical protein